MSQQSISLRDLIYGSQASVDDDENNDISDNENDENEAKRGSYKPLGQVYSSLPRKRKTLPSYSKFPEVKKKSTVFPPGCYSFQKFQQYENPPQGVNREILRSLWNQACYGGDLDAAIRILNTMIRVDSIDFSDFHQFLLLLRSNSHDTLSTISSISFETITTKLPAITTTRSKSFKSIFEMLLELYITSSHSNSDDSKIIDKTVDMITKFMLHPAITGDYHLESLLTMLYCLQAIELCSSLIREIRPPPGHKPSITERYQMKKQKKYQRNLISALMAERAVTQISLLAPSCLEICQQPLRFAETISTLRIYETKYTKKFGEDQTIHTRRILPLIGSSFDRTFRDSGHPSNLGIDFSLLHAGYLHGIGKSNEAREILFSSRVGNSKRGCRASLYFLAMTAPTEQQRIITTARGFVSPKVLRLIDPNEAESAGGDRPQQQSSGTRCEIPTSNFPDLEELSCACRLFLLGELMESELVEIICDALEKSIPTTLQLKEGQLRNSGNIDVIFSTNIPFHFHTLWSNLANLLGPYHRQIEEFNPSGIDIHGLFHQIGSQRLRAEYGLLSNSPTEPITLDFLRKYTFDSQYFEYGPKHQCQFVDLFDEASNAADNLEHRDDENDDNPMRSTNIVNPPSTTIPLPTTPLAPPTSIDRFPVNSILDKFRIERSWWAESGHVFSNSFLGDELSWGVMEFVTEKMLLAALHRFSSLPESATLNDISDLSFNESILEMREIKSKFLFSKPSSDENNSNVDSEDKSEDLSGDDSDNSSILSLDAASDAVSDAVSQQSDESDAWGPTTTTISHPDKIPDSDDDDDDDNDADGGGGVEKNPRVNNNTPPIPQLNPSGLSEYPDELWNDFLLWLRYENHSSPPPAAPHSLFPSSSSGNDNSETRNSMLGDFDIKKSRYELSSVTPLWSILNKVYSLRSHSSGPLEKIIFYCLGEKLLEMLTYQILVYCHLTGSLNGLWVCQAVQVLIQQGQDNLVALRCLAYLTSMGVDILEIVRNGNTHRGLGCDDIHVKSCDLIEIPQEQLLHHTTSLSYDPL